MDIPRGGRVSDSSTDSWERSGCGTALRVLNRSVCRADRSLGRAAPAEIFCDSESAADGGVDSLRTSRYTAPARISGFKRRTISADSVAQWRNKARGHDVVSAWARAGALFARVVGCHYS